MPHDAASDRFGIKIGRRIWRLTPGTYAPMDVPPRAVQGPGRFDDPSIETSDSGAGYAVFYCAESPVAPFLEVLARYRPSIEDLIGMRNDLVVDVMERDGQRPDVRKAVEEWSRAWHLGSSDVVMHATVFDLANPESVQFLRQPLALMLHALGINDLDFGDMLGSHRQLTRAISYWVWSQTQEGGEPRYSGIRYRSRLDPDQTSLVLFEHRFELVGSPRVDSITSDTPGFAEALQILRLQIA